MSTSCTCITSKQTLKTTLLQLLMEWYDLATVFVYAVIFALMETKKHSSENHNYGIFNNYSTSARWI